MPQAQAVKLMMPLIEGSRIINLQQILEVLKACEDLALLEEYQNEVMQIIQGTSDDFDLDGIEPLAAALSLRFEELANQKSSNKDRLETLKEQNPKLVGLSVIETSRHENDSAKYLDYIKFVGADGQVQILECPFGSALNDFIEANPELVLTASAEEIFNHFKENINSSLKFGEFSVSTVSDIGQTLEKMDIKSPLINNPAAFADEKRQIEKYIAEHHHGVQAKVAINSSGERVYLIGEEVLKFQDVSGKREMAIISGQTSLNDETLEVPVAPTNTAGDMTSQQVAEMADEALLDSGKPNIIGVDYFNYLLVNLESGTPITEAEEVAMGVFMSDVMKRRAGGIAVNYDEQNAVDLYAEHLKQKSAPLPVMPKPDEDEPVITTTEYGRLVINLNNGLEIAPEQMNAVQSFTKDLLVMCAKGLLADERLIDALIAYMSYLNARQQEVGLSEIESELFMEHHRLIEDFLNHQDDSMRAEPTATVLAMMTVITPESLEALPNDVLTEAQRALLAEYEALNQAPPTEAMTLALRPPNQDGIGITAAIIEVTILLGILIAVLALVKS